MSLFVIADTHLSLSTGKNMNVFPGWDDYESRLYLYERSVLYNFSSLMLYGKGIRYWLMARANLGKSLLLTAKIGITDYFNRNQIGSSYQLIDGSSQTDLDLQLRWRI